MSNFTIEIKKKRLLKNKIGEKYTQYRLPIPKHFVDRHKTEEVYCIANNLIIVAPKKEMIFKIIKKIPEIEELLQEGV